MDFLGKKKGSPAYCCLGIPLEVEMVGCPQKNVLMTEFLVCYFSENSVPARLQTRWSNVA
jgi:hypothetical protein